MRRAVINESQLVQAVTRDTGLGHADARKAVDSVIAAGRQDPAERRRPGRPPAAIGH
jgi:hypothetical protein